VFNTFLLGCIGGPLDAVPMYPYHVW